MLNNKLLIVIGCCVIVLSLLALAIYLSVADLEDATDSEPIQESDTQLNVTEPIFELNSGNEAYVDNTVADRLELMRRGVPAMDELGNYMLDDSDNLVYEGKDEKGAERVGSRLSFLINYFAEKGYSMAAHHQVQRLYFEYHERWQSVPLVTLCDQISRCIPAGGTDAVMLTKQASEVFGIQRGDQFLFVFDPVVISKRQVAFCDVKPPALALEEDLKALCIYEIEKSEWDDGYERNLEGWLHQVIARGKSAGLTDKQIQMAQLLYLGSLADAEYRSDWARVLAECLMTDPLTYDVLKLSVIDAFGVCIDYNTPLRQYFESKNMEVTE